MDSVMGGVLTVATAIVGLAVLAVLVSRSANTANVISSAAHGFAEDIGAAVSPVTGSGFSGSFNLGYN
jgi:hypothetical protein